MSPATRWSFHGELVPEGTPIEVWTTTAGRLATSPLAGSQPLPGRYALAGLVDAHCHLTLVDGGTGPLPDGDTASVRERLRAVRKTGVLMLRDAGGVGGIPLALAAEEPDRVLAAGKFLAPAGQYFPELLEPEPRGALVAAALAEVRKGAAWVKLVGDFRRLDVEGRPVEPTYDLDEVRAMVDAVHSAGSRVAAHTTSRRVSGLVEAGVDSVEHGPAMVEDDLRALGARGGAWTPTLTAMLGPPDRPMTADDPDAVELADRLRTLLPAAEALGVRVLTGSDVAGSVAQEVAWLVRLGLSPAAALAAASSSARAYLARPGAVDGAPADLVTYDDDPREDPDVLQRPVAVLVGGVRLR